MKFDTRTVTGDTRPGSSRSIRRLCTAACAIAVTMLVAQPAAADRPSDKDVKALLERINQERDRFEDQLDGNLKRSILRGPNGELSVERYLDDLQDNVGKMKDRFSADYAASAEVTTVLGQASNIHRYMSKQPPNFDGASEWTRLAESLGQLAATYGTTMPMPEGYQARRMNDKEVRKVIDGVGASADTFGKALDATLKADKTVDKATRETAVKAAGSIKEDAKRLSSALGDGRPASGEAKALLDRAAAVRGASSSRMLSPAAQTAWGSVESGLDTVALVFGLPVGR